VTRTLAVHLVLGLAIAFAGTASAKNPGKKPPAPKKDPKPPVEAPPPEPPPPPPPAEPAGEPQPKPGDKRRSIAVLEVKLGEGVPSEVSSQFAKELDALIDRKMYWVAYPHHVHDLMGNSTKWTEGCVVGSCLHEVRAQTGADVVLLAALTGSGTSFGSVITLVRTDNGRVLSQEIKRCDVCTISEAVKTATQTAIAQLSSIPETLPDETAVTRDAVESTRTQLEAKIDRLERDSHHMGTGLVLLISGLAAVGAGIALYELENHASYGLAAAGLGGGLALGGVVVLTF
jgi:hypothetical protein